MFLAIFFGYIVPYNAAKWFEQFEVFLPERLSIPPFVRDLIIDCRTWQSVSEIRHSFHRRSPESVRHICLCKHSTNHVVESTIHAFCLPIALRCSRWRWLILNAKRLQNWSEMTFVFSAAIDVQFLDFLAGLSFDFCDVF